MIINRIRTEARDQNWVSAIVDLLIVVIGLFTGLQVDSWWEDYQQSRQERVYLQELQEDFISNKDLLVGTIEYDEEVLNDMISLSEQALTDTPSLSNEELDAQFSSLQSMPTISPISRAYDNLVGAGELSVINSREIKNGLADFYSFSKMIELVQNTHEMQLVQLFQPYMHDNTEVARVLVSWQEDDDFLLPEPESESGLPDVISSREFRNIVTAKYYSVSDLYGLHTALQELNDEILQLLQSELGIRITEEPGS